MSKTYITLVIFCVCSAALVDALRTWAEAATVINAALEECKTKVGASDADIIELLSRKAASTKKGKCLHSCLITNILFRVPIDHDNIVGAAVASAREEKHALKLEHPLSQVNVCYFFNPSGESCDLADQEIYCLFKQAKKYWTRKPATV